MPMKMRGGSNIAKLVGRGTGPLVVGLTGGIGCGKSTVAEQFAALGADLIDADAVAHELSRRGEPGWTAVREAFGDAVLRPDGELDRAALRQRVFADPAAKARLEAALHPLIADAIEHRLASWRAAYGLLMVPLLIEGGRYRDRIDRLLVIDCEPAEQVRRVMARSALSEGEVRAIMATQVDRQTRLAAADDVIDNSGPPEAIAPAVASLDQRYRQLAAEIDASGRAAES
jgi:dephospho-CoA kinase